MTARSRPSGVDRTSHTHQLVLVGITAVAVGTVVLVVDRAAAAVDRPFDFLSKDPAGALEAPRYVGMLAHLTVVVWLAPAFAGLVAGAALLPCDRRRGLFQLAAGGFAGLLALDDLFLLHEAVYPKLGVSSIGAAAAYGVLAAAFAWWFRADIRSVDGELLLLAGLAALAGSAAVDELLYDSYVLEDGLKALGVALWAVFGVRAAHRHLRDAVSGHAAGDPARRPT